MGKVVSVTNSKGGVGKTTLNAHLAFFLKDKGYKVLVIDQEHPGAISTYFDSEYRYEGDLGLQMYLENVQDPKRYTTDTGVDLLVTGGDLNRVESCGWDSVFIFKENVENLSKHYDYIFIDTPPTLTKRLEFCIACCDVVFTPLVPEPLVFVGFNSFIEKYNTIRQRVNPKLPEFPYVFFNNVNGNSVKHKKNMDDFFEVFNNERFILKPDLYRRSMVPDCVDENKPVWDYSDNSQVKREFLGMMEKMYLILKGV